jgi:hypothetical protein
MTAQPESPVRLAFGPFELDSAAGELRRVVFVSGYRASPSESYWSYWNIQANCLAVSNCARRSAPGRPSSISSTA